MMLELQDQINQNVQERLRMLEATQEINLSLLIAIISTHPDRQALQNVFETGCDSLAAAWKNKPLPEDYTEHAVAFRNMLRLYFRSPVKPSH